MSEATFTRKRRAPFRFDTAARTQVEALSDTELVARATADLDNPPVEPERLHRMETAREVRRIRETTGLSQPQFAARYQIRLGRLRDYEQARSEPDFPIMAYLRLIADYRDVADRVVEGVKTLGIVGKVSR